MTAAPASPVEPAVSDNAWPSEFSALVQLLRVALGRAGKDDFRWPAGLDPAAFGTTVTRHRVGALLQHRLASDAREALPSLVQDQLQEAARSTARRALERSAELARIAKRFGGAGIPFLSVKGPLLARWLHADVGARHAGDLDLLIAPERLADADAALRAAGCRRSQPDFELTPRQWREYQRLKHEFEYFNDAAQIRLEVEWRLEGLGDAAFDEWLAAGARDALGGVEIARLPAETECVYLFVHGAGHGWFRLFWLVDVALLLMRDDVNWHSVMQLARTRQVETSLWQGGQLVERLLGLPLPEALRVPAGQQARVNRLTQEALRRMQAAEPRGGLAELLRETRYQLRLRQSWPGRAAVLRPRLMSPSNWKMLRLPDRWFALYYLAAPCLWLRRRFSSKT
ncbi:MAG: hypothetical protein FD161_3035 [Limisphaerales bacterium]|nr:MAG: hypothetical protein FD161_3035 [Limisphaerales bacterium]KAG0508148.1 MAG: hypothetical protein E1N63_2742 [Limisphaerales bacterium]TXT52999.1 MAG: hypothetical protein FD140_107 [Limisphaerales bacterium]